jgi:hypothetical protein
MAAKITPRLIELTYEAALKSYWRKEAHRKFLRASHVSETFLSTWDLISRVRRHASQTSEAYLPVSKFDG